MIAFLISTCIKIFKSEIILWIAQIYLFIVFQHLSLFYFVLKDELWQVFFSSHVKKNSTYASCFSVTQPKYLCANVFKTSCLILMCFCFGNNENEQLFVLWVLFLSFGYLVYRGISKKRVNGALKNKQRFNLHCSWFSVSSVSKDLVLETRWYISPEAQWFVICYRNWASDLHD